jgi:MFS family permease
MTVKARISTLAPFHIRSYRYQWPADLSTSWAFEMETIILGWYVLVETQSVFMLTLFASLQHIGTLLAPMFGVMGDRVGHRNVLCAMRGIYAMLALTLMTLAFTEVLTPAYALSIAALMGLVRPSDIGMRAALVGDTMPPTHLMGAMSIQRTTQDSAKVIGALSGAGLVAMLGIGPAYMVVTLLYATSLVLTLQVGRPRSARKDALPAKDAPPAVSPWRDLREGMAYVWRTPHLFAVMLLAFMLNLTAFPLQNGLLPYVAKEIYFTDQTGLGYMVAGAASGALFGSIVLSRFGALIARPARVMVVFSAMWLAVLLVFSQLEYHAAGIAVLVVAGFMQSLGQIPMVTILLRTSDERFRGRLMGIRMLAIYGNLPGLLLAGPLITTFGYRATAAFYCLLGISVIAYIAIRYRAHFWSKTAPANTR